MNIVRDTDATIREMYTYFALVIVLSWGYVLAGGLPAIDATIPERQQWYLNNAWVILWAPMLLALVCALAFRGREGLMTILRRVVRFNVPLKYYLFAFLAGPLVVMLSGLMLTLFGHQAFPDQPLLEVLKAFGMAFAMLFVIIIGEELGWRGYAQPGLQGSMSSLRAAVTVGIVWGAWHWPVWYGASPDAAGSSPHALAMLAVMTAMTVVMSIVLAWLVNCTRASIPIAMIWHGAHNASLALIALQPAALSASFVSMLIWGLIALFLVWRYREAYLTTPVAS